MSDLCTTTFAARAARLGFPRDTAGELDPPAGPDVLIIDDFALQPMDGTETADANTLS